MLIMQPTNVDFQGIADKIANSFIEKGASIEDSIVEEAKRLELNPEEVKRLVEKTNTACSIKSMRCSDDKKQEFDLASKESVLSRTHPIDDDDEDDDEDDDKYDDYEEKKAFELPVTRITAKPDTLQKKAYTDYVKEPTADFTRSVHSLKNIIEKTRQEKVAVEQELQRNIDYLCKSYRKHPEAFHKVASEYLIINGNSLAAPYLRSISDHLGAKESFEKQAAFVDDTVPEMAVFRSIENGHAKLAELTSSLAENSAIFGKIQEFIKKQSVI